VKVAQRKTARRSRLLAFLFALVRGLLTSGAHLILVQPKQTRKARLKEIAAYLGVAKSALDIVVLIIHAIKDALR
jgi:hypothetical protein